MKEEWEWREGINVGKRMREEDMGKGKGEFRGVYKDGFEAWPADAKVTDGQT